jgi:hypothetical protein
LIVTRLATHEITVATVAGANVVLPALPESLLASNRTDILFLGFRACAVERLDDDTMTETKQQDRKFVSENVSTTT